MSNKFIRKEIIDRIVRHQEASARAYQEIEINRMAQRLSDQDKALLIGRLYRKQASQSYWARNLLVIEDARK